jgi:hypothetical protein
MPSLVVDCVARAIALHSESAERDLPPVVNGIGTERAGESRDAPLAETLGEGKIGITGLRSFSLSDGTRSPPRETTKSPA